MLFLHSLQGHASAFHDLINFSNLHKELLYLILFGTSSRVYVFSPKLITIYNDLKLYEGFCSLKISFIISGAILCLTL